MGTAIRSRASLAAATLTSVHTMTNDGIISVALANRSTANLTFRIAIVDGAPTGVANEDYINYGGTLESFGQLERSGIMVKASDQICVYASATGMSAHVYGFDQFGTVTRGRASLAATTLTSIRTATTTGTYNIALCNRSTAAINYRIAVVDGAPAAVAAEDYISYNTQITGNGYYERTAVVIKPSDQICVYASATGISAHAWGFER